MVQQKGEPMYCPHCGAKGLDTRDVCQVCGRQPPEQPGEVLAAAEEREQEEGCGNCGAALGGDEVFCGACGARLLARNAAEGTGVAFKLATGHGEHPFSFTAGQHKSSAREELGGDKVFPERKRRAFLGEVSVLGERNVDGLSGEGKDQAEFGAWPTGEGVEGRGRGRLVLVISALCFAASMVSGGAAIWLAVVGR
jgi:hypothetical protein